MSQETLTIVDNRTGKKYELKVESGTIRATDLRRIKTSESDFGLISYDPGFLNTASCRSSITFIDGERGILEYRGYPIEQLAEHSTYLETAYLILNGDLPSAAQLKDWTYDITHHTFLHENVKKFIDGFHHDAHPMGMLVSTVAALSTFYPESKEIFDERLRMIDLLSRSQPDTRSRRPPAPDRAADRQDPDPGRVLLPPQRRPAVRLPRQ
jgi:citrate synthase